MAPKLQDSGLRIVSGERLMKHVGLWLSASLCLAASTAMGADKVSFGTNWLAEAEHGGYYQAAADGTYAKYGLDVTIVQGGPQANNGLLLAAGKLDFYMGGNLLLAFDAVDQNLPIVVVAAHFQKDPQMVMSHPGVGLDTWSELPKATAISGKRGSPRSIAGWSRTTASRKRTYGPTLSILRPSSPTRMRSSRAM